MNPNALECDYAEVSVENAVKALYILQGCEEYEKECVSLKKKITKMFKKVPTTKGEKILNGYHYQPSGLIYCYDEPEKWDIKVQQCVCEPWPYDDIDLEDERENRKKAELAKIKRQKRKASTDRTFIRSYNNMGHKQTTFKYQMLSYLNRKYEINRPNKWESNKDKRLLRDYASILDAVKLVGNEEAKVAGINVTLTQYKACNTITKCFREIFFTYNQYRTYTDFTIGSAVFEIVFLNKEGLEYLCGIYDMIKKDESDFSYEENNIVRNAVMNIPEQFIIHTGLTDELLKDHVLFKMDPGSSTYGARGLSYDTYKEKVYPIISKLAEEHEHLRIFFGDVGFMEKIPKNKRTKKGEIITEETK